MLGVNDSHFIKNTIYKYDLFLLWYFLYMVEAYLLKVNPEESKKNPKHSIRISKEQRWNSSSFFIVRILFILYMADGQMTGYSVASVRVFGDQIPWNLKSIIPDYFLTFPIQKCTALIYFSQLILVENKGVIKMYSHGLLNCFSNFFFCNT